MSYIEITLFGLPATSDNVPVRGVHIGAVSQDDFVGISHDLRDYPLKTVDILLLALLYGLIWAWCIYN